MIDRLRAANLISRGQGGEFLDPEAVLALLDRPIDAERLSVAMSAAYKSVGSWDDFDDAVLAFAEATVREYRDAPGEAP